MPNDPERAGESLTFRSIIQVCCCFVVHEHCRPCQHKCLCPICTTVIASRRQKSLGL
ncbi:hypothetical protein GQ44DRAFT_696862 [Phaeosphaeriaceae sp. PMI808]|nr:hypothetical protein GQ44DRAFT_696862 [Phaeosphaeriaceae sp. PMI808]